MKKFLLLIFILCVVTSAWAKSISTHVEFTYDKDFEEGITKFSLYYLDITAPDGRQHVVDVLDVTLRAFDTPTFDLPPGKTSEFILVAVEKDGTEQASPVYPFKFTGKPTINRINKK